MSSEISNPRIQRTFTGDLPTAPCSLDKLPTDLLQIIFGHIVTHLDTTGDYSSWKCVCKKLKAAAESYPGLAQRLFGIGVRQVSPEDLPRFASLYASHPQFHGLDIPLPEKTIHQWGFGRNGVGKEITPNQQLSYIEEILEKKDLVHFILSQRSPHSGPALFKALSTHPTLSCITLKKADRETTRSAIAPDIIREMASHTWPKLRTIILDFSSLDATSLMAGLFTTIQTPYPLRMIIRGMSDLSQTFSLLNEFISDIRTNPKFESIEIDLRHRVRGFNTFHHQLEIVIQKDKSVVRLNNWVYDGGFKDYLPNGKGRLLDSDNVVKFEGEFKNGFPESGTGTLSAHADALGNGTLTVTGSFTNGHANGEATIVYPNARQYKGNCRSNEPHGKGVLKYPNDKSFEGIFRDGAPYNGKGYFEFRVVKPPLTPPEQGEPMKFDISTSSFSGTLTNDLSKKEIPVGTPRNSDYLPYINGEGTLTDCNGHAVTGRFHEGHFVG